MGGASAVNMCINETQPGKTCMSSLGRFLMYLGSDGQPLVTDNPVQTQVSYYPSAGTECPSWKGTGWFLPTIQQLEALWPNRSAIGISALSGWTKAPESLKDATHIWTMNTTDGSRWAVGTNAGGTMDLRCFRRD